ncbi:MAG: glycosyltransferase family 4 protein [Fibrobacter sp.]|nr:glycosyltransferase family 4 protein [Fibrobacter sp.]
MNPSVDSNLQKSKHKLVIAVDSYWPQKGGVEKAAQSLASSLKEQFSIKIITHRISHNSTLYSTYTSLKKQSTIDPAGNEITLLDSSCAGRLELLPLILWNLPGVKRNAPRFDYLYKFYRTVFKKRLKNLLSDANVVHCFSTGYLARCVTEVCIDQKISFVHSPFVHFGRWGDSPAQLDSYSKAGAIFCPTVFFRNKLMSHYKDSTSIKTEIIPPIISEPCASSFEKEPVQGRFVLFLGRRESHKGLNALLDAFEGIKENVKLVIAGPGATAGSLHENVVDLGEVDDNTRDWLFSRCDLLCLPSMDETFGIVYTEAMSCGKPVVAWDIPPVNEIVQDGISGILVEPQNTVALRSALEKLLSNVTTCASMGRAAHDRFNNYFSAGKIVKEHHRVYRNLTGTNLTGSEE